MSIGKVGISQAGSSGIGIATVGKDGIPEETGVDPILCGDLTYSFLAAFPVDTIDVVFAGNQITATRNGASSNPGANQDAVNLFNITGAAGPLVFEVNCAAPSVLNDNGGLGGGLLATDFTAAGGVILDFGTGVNGVVTNFLTGAPIASGLTYPAAFPVVYHFEVDEAGTFFWEFEDGNGTSIASGSEAATGASFTGKTCEIVNITNPAATNLSTIATTFVGNAPFTIPLNDSSAATWCTFPVGAPPEPVEMFLQNQPPDSTVTLINSDRTINIDGDGITEAGFSYSAGWSAGGIPAGQENPDGNVFEFEITANDIQEFLIALQLFAQGKTQITFLFGSFSDTYLIFLGGVTLLRGSLDAGDVFAYQYIDNGASPTEIRFYYIPNGGTPLVMDTFTMDADSDFATIVGNLGGTPADTTNMQIDFNAVESQMSHTYPDGSKDYEGTALVTTSGPFVAVPATWYETGFTSRDPALGDTMVVSGGGKTLTATNGGGADTAEGYVVSPASAKSDDSIYAATLKVVTADASNKAPEIGFRGMGGDNSDTTDIKVTRNNSGDIILDILPMGSTTILAATPIDDDDYLTIELDTENEQAKGHFWDDSASTLTSTAWVSYAGQGKTMFIPTGGVDQLDDGEACVLENQFDELDMDQANTKAALSAGAIDVLGQVIT